MCLTTADDEFAWLCKSFPTDDATSCISICACKLISCDLRALGFIFPVCAECWVGGGWGGGVWGDPPRGRHWWGRCFFWVGFGIATREMLPPGGHVDVTHELQIGRVVNNIVVVSQGPWSSCRKWSSSNILRPLFTRLCKIKSWQESGAQAAFVSPPTFVKLMFCHIKVNDTKGTGLAAYSQQRTTVTRGSSHGRGTFGNTVIMLWAFSRVLFFIGHSIFVQLCGIKLAACYKGAHP